MNGMELSRKFFFEAGLPLLQGRYPELVDRVAAGLVAGGFASGCGSEIGGFDDDLSRDHNWGARFFLFLSAADVNWFLQTAMRACFLLKRRYAPYCKWSFKAFQQLDGIPSDLSDAIQTVAGRIDMNSITNQLYAIADRIGTMANESGSIDGVPLRKPSPFFWSDFNCYGFMEAFHKKVIGSLAVKTPYEGPYDLLATNGNINQEIMRAAWKTLQG